MVAQLLIIELSNLFATHKECNVHIFKDEEIVIMNNYHEIYYLQELFYKVRLIHEQKKWRKRNPNNKTELNCIVPFKRISVGYASYGVINLIAYNNDDDLDNSKLIIGNYCSISSTALFMLGGGHDFSRISSYPFKNYLYGTNESISSGNIIINDDAWIGERVTVMSGVTIGQGAVIGTNSLVNKDIPPYAIAVGIPAKVIKYRFSSELVEELLKIDFRKLTDDMLKEHIDELYKPLNDISQLKWLPRK